MSNMIPVYYENAAYARDHGEIEQYRASHRANIECRDAIETAIREHFDGWTLRRQAVQDVLAQHGAERVALVLAATVQIKSWDGRFSRDNKGWAIGVRMPVAGDDPRNDRRDSYVVRSHPAVLDGFIDFARRAMGDAQ